MNLNKVYLIGRLTADPESRTTSTGRAVTTFRMATNRVWTDASGQKNENPEYHTVVTWTKLAEIASLYLRRGGLVMVEGRLQTRSWNAQDGTKRYRTEVVAETLQLGPRPSQSSSTQPPQNDQSSERQEDIPVINEDETTINPDDIPF